LDLTTPEGTPTHTVVPHSTIVETLIEALGLRHIVVVRDEYAVSSDGHRLFGVLEVDQEHTGVRLAVGLRNSHDKTFSLAMTVGYRVFVCDNLAFHGDFTPLTRKHSKNFDHIEVIDYAVGKMQRHFEPMKRTIDVWQAFELSDARAKAVIYDAFIAGRLPVTRRLAPLVHEHYFRPSQPEFMPRTMWSLGNAFTSAFKQLDPIPQMQATARLAPFLASVQA
jgi:hypothetical protein